MNDKNKAGLSIALVCLVLGMMLVAQFRTTQISGSAYTSHQRAQEIAQELKNITDERDMLKKEVLNLRLRIDEYENSASKISSLTEAMQKELEKTRMMAGLTAGEGPGVVITLDDSNVPKQPGEDPNLYLIHDEDILRVINELFAAGAEAVSVNDLRIVATSEVRCVGPTIIVNSIRLAPPFTIKAVGDPDVLEASLKMRGGIIEYLEVYNIQVSIKKQDKIQMPAYTRPIQLNYLKPTKAVKINDLSANWPYYRFVHRLYITYQYTCKIFFIYVDCHSCSTR